MDKSQKLKCEYRYHQDFTQPAQCRKFESLLNLQTGPEFKPESCHYCLDNPCNKLSQEPFTSQYLKHRNNLQNITDFSFANCMMLGEPNSDKDVLTIDEYAKSTHQCHAFHECQLLPVINTKTCTICYDRLNIHYVADDNPDYSIYGKMPKHGQIEKWAVGIVTAPRKNPTITKTMLALEKAGWDAGIIFTEPNNNIDFGPNWPIVQRQQQLGIFGNWILGLYELFIRNIDADAYLIMQDDVVLAPNSRQYLTDVLWFEEKPHIVSLFGPNAINHDQQRGWKAAPAYHGGPNALVLSHQMVQEILSSMVPIRYYAVKRQKENSFDDLGIFVLAHQKGLNTYFPRPSIGDHIGHQSTHCQQSSNWVYSDYVLSNHQYNNVEHWFITDATKTTNKLGITKDSLGKLENINWLIIEDPNFDYKEYLKHSCRTDWIITTNIPPGTILLSDIRKEIIRYFNYQKQWLRFGFGKSKDTYLYSKVGPCLTVCERTQDLETCLSPPDNIRTIHNRAFWQYDS